MTTANGEPKGVGGWLILPLIGLFVAIIRLTSLLATIYVPIFTEHTWDVLTTPGSAAYHALWGPLIIAEIVFNTGFVLWAVVLIVLLLTKSHRLPYLMVAFYAVNLVFVLGDFFAAGLLPIEASARVAALREVFTALVGAAIWIPYFLLSKRVKNTFVKPASAEVPLPVSDSQA